MDYSINRRRLLQGMAATAGAASVSAGARAAQKPGAVAFDPAAGNRPDVVVIGAGAFGGWSALCLQEAGFKTTLVDVYRPGNPHASSGGESRNIRSGYGDRAIYSEWAARAWVAWHEREAEFGRKLIYPSGSLRDPGDDQFDAQVAVFEQLGLPYEILSPEEVHSRWPAIRFDDRERIFYDVNSGGVKAREAMIAVSEVFQQKGGTLMLGEAKPGPGTGGKMDYITVNGEPLHAGTFVFALGPWFPKVFPEFMGNMISVPRSELFYVAPAKGDYRYDWANIPGISDTITYTTADIGGGFKIAGRGPRQLMDPDDDTRMPTPALIKSVEDYIKIRLPGLEGRPILQSYVCQTEGTNTGHYLFDTHPEFDNVWLAGGGSGHAFKMGPILGTYVRDLVAGVPMSDEHKALFPLAAHGPVNALTREMA